MAKPLEKGHREMLLSIERLPMFLVPLAFALSLGWSSVANGQTDHETAGARAAAKTGVEAYQAGDYEKALQLLERAESLVHAPTHLLFIARSQVKLGKLVEAQEAFKKVITENLKDNAPQAFLAAQEAAHQELTAVEARIAQLRVDVEAANSHRLKSVKISINGTLLPSALIGLAVPANPGLAEITVSATGMLSQTKKVDLAEGGDEAVHFTLEVDPNAPVPEQGPPAMESSSPGDPAVDSGPQRDGQWTAGWATLGAGGALLITGGTLGILSTTQLNRANSDEALCAPDKLCTEEGKQQVDSAQAKALVADISLGVGLAAVGVGAYLLLTSGKSSQDVGVRTLVPSADRNGGYLFIQGGF